MSLGSTVLSLIDAMEKAQGERAEALEAVAFQNKVIVSGALKVNEARTERDSARALLREIHGWLDLSLADRARIAKELAQ